MYSINRLIALIISLFALTATAQIPPIIVYLNGASNTDQKSLDDNQAAFKRKISKLSGISDAAFKGYDIKQSKLYSLESILCHRDVSTLSFPRGIYGGLLIPSDYNEYLNALGGFLRNPSNSLTKCLLNPSSQQMLKYSNAIFNASVSILKNGGSIVFVGHSQGNLYIENVLSLILTSDTPKLLEKIKVVNIANMGALNFNDNYFNISLDQALYKARNYILWPYVAPSKSVLCLNDCKVIATYDELNNFTGDENLHGINTYLNDNLLLYPDKISLVNSIARGVRLAYDKLDKAVYIKSKKPTRIALALNTTTASNWLSRTLNTAFAFLGIRDAVAQSLPSLFAYVNSGYTVRVDGTGFDGNEAVSIAGSSCNTATIQRGGGYFTQSCTGGSAAADSNKIRVYDTTYDLDIEVPTAYQTMQLRGPILAPLAPALTEPTTGTIRLSWSAVSGATGYEVSRGGTAISTVGTTTSYDDTGRTAGTSYCYRLRTIQGGIMSAYSPEACYTPATIRCAGTWNNTQYSVGATETTTQACQSGYTGNKTLSHICQASGSWGATTTQDNCTLTPAPTCTGSWSSAKYLIGQLEEVYQNNCPAGTTGQVRSWHTCQASGSSAVWGGLSQSDNCTAYLAAPQSVNASSGGNSGMLVTWGLSSGATGYNVYKGTTASTLYLYKQFPGLNSISTYYDDAVVNGSYYCYALTATSTYGGGNIESARSSTSCTTYQNGSSAPPTPSSFTVSRPTSGAKALNLSWSASTGADSYLIYRYDNRPNSFLTGVGISTSFSDTIYGLPNGLTSGISFCYKIQAQKGSLLSPLTDYQCAIAP